MNRTVREVIQENIVEEIDLFRDFYKDFINMIQTIDENYESKLSFNEFYIKILGNFEGVDDEFDLLTKREYLKKLYDSFTKTGKDELNYNPEYLKKYEKIIEEVK